MNAGGEQSYYNQPYHSQPHFKGCHPNFMRNVSVNISEGTSLKPIIIELVRQADIDLQLDPKIDAKIVFSAKDSPFIRVIDGICQLAGLRYEVFGRALKIQNDEEYIENYNVQFLNLARTSDNRVSIATDVFTKSSPGGGDGAKPSSAPNDNGSNSNLQVSGKTDFWEELEKNLKIILSGEGVSYSMHRQGGIIAVRGKSKHHKLIKNYLNTLKMATNSQVLIEAKIIEVVLNDEFKSGINWQMLSENGKFSANAPFGVMANSSRFMDSYSKGSNFVSMGIEGKGFSSILDALQSFGSLKTLSSPRLTVMNNQSAILKVAKNEVYFRPKYDKQFNTDMRRESVTVTSDIQTVPIGFVMTVQPSIDPQTGEIVLFLRPTISRLNKSARDPAVDIMMENARNANCRSHEKKDGDASGDKDDNGKEGKPGRMQPSLVPVVEVREVDSVLKLKSGDCTVLGGLMEVRSVSESEGLPIVSDIPIANEIFGAQSRGDHVVELVIVLKATIINNSPNQRTDQLADQRLFGYINDPRPF